MFMRYRPRKTIATSAIVVHEGNYERVAAYIQDTISPNHPVRVVPPGGNEGDTPSITFQAPGISEVSDCQILPIPGALVAYESKHGAMYAIYSHRQFAEGLEFDFPSDATT